MAGWEWVVVDSPAVPPPGGAPAVGWSWRRAFGRLGLCRWHLFAVHRCDTVVVAYDVDLANRIRDVVQDEPGLTEKRMFGGLAFLINGNMAVSASSRGGMLLRVDPADTPDLVQRPEASRFEMRGREMDGWLLIEPTGLATERELRSWVARGVSYARKLPAK
jgi:TfoX/Sxy family transcriptional regulator of competence genes